MCRRHTLSSNQPEPGTRNQNQNQRAPTPNSHPPSFPRSPSLPQTQKVGKSPSTANSRTFHSSSAVASLYTRMTASMYQVSRSWSSPPSTISPLLSRSHLICGGRLEVWEIRR